VKAMCPGEITSIRGSSEVLLETVGALIQCAWGNGKREYVSYRMEPSGGIEAISHGQIDSAEYRNVALVVNRPILDTSVFRVAFDLELAALVAPSMPSNLRELALRQTIPVILTDGFGKQPMSEVIFKLLSDNVGRPALFDATEPERWSTSRPEIIIPLPAGTAGNPPTPEVDQPVIEGATVRATRAPFAGMTGRVRRLVETPRSVENGLRLAGAEVQLTSGQTVFVPLANLELLGRAADAPGTGGS
jgi:hypothetical protein